MLELNEKNVNDIFNNVQRTSRTSSSLPVPPIRNGISTIFLDKNEMKKYSADISLMASQLKAVSDKKNFLSYPDTAYLYNGLTWTDKSSSIDKFHYLLSYLGILGIPLEKNGTTLYEFLAKLNPTIPIMRLSEKNIAKIMKAGFRTDDSKPNTTTILGANDYPTAYFDKTILDSTYQDVLNMFGQTYVVHSKSPKFDMIDLSTLYDGSKWTKDSVSLRSLYYLLRGNGIITKTERRGPTSFRDIHRTTPTFFEGDKPKSERVFGDD
ncbi:MAG: hypothetical protein HFJ46_07455 [Clostridia bacterium]|nr:hypothetical protein [Clostridia bacterium]